MYGNEMKCMTSSKYFVLTLSSLCSKLRYYSFKRIFPALDKPTFHFLSVVDCKLL